MKAFGAALIALAMLYVIDSEYNNARYTQAVEKPPLGLRPVGQTDGRLPVRFFVAGCFSPARNNP
jgi:hypothetical protein